MEEPDAGPNNSSLEQPSTDPGKLPVPPVGLELITGSLPLGALAARPLLGT